MKNLGMVGIRSVYNRYLQAHEDNGELHASNPNRNEEETWFLVDLEVDENDPNSYAIYNWKNGQFLSKVDAQCARANSTTLSGPQTWNMILGQDYGVLNAVAFQSAIDGAFLRTEAPGNDTDCGGEVAAFDKNGPPVANGQWPGWWVLSPATEPTAGKDPWNIVGGYVEGILNKVTPADIVKLIAALGGGD